MVTRRHLLAGGAAIAVSGTVAGCSGFSTEEGPFAFETVAFTAGQPEGYENYDEQSDSTYPIGETVWILVAVENVPVDDDGTATLEYTFDVETPDGESWDRENREEQWEDVDTTDVLIIWEGFATFEEDPPGEYELTITVEEQSMGETIRTTETFTLEQQG